MRLGQSVGPYRVVEKLGEGGMGEVYRARDTRLDRDVALKFLRDQPRAGDELLREARAASALNHPHICQIFDVGHSDAGDWIAMEYVAGERLDAHLAPRGLAPEMAASLGEQLAGALGHAHAQGIIHRDFKTANCVRRSDGVVKILDFGLATRSLEHLAREETRSASLARPEATVVRDVATGAERDLPPPHMHSPRFSHDGRWIAGWRHDNSAGVCDAGGTGCRALGKASSAVAWSADDSRLYVLRPAAGSDEQEVWSVAIDGGSERKERTVGTFRSIDRFFDLSINGEIVSAPFFEGRPELWTAPVH